MKAFMDFLTMIYQGNNGGTGLFLAFCVVAGVFGEIAIAIIRRFPRSKY